MKMAPNSLFAILLRNPWWMSLALAAAIILLVRMVIPIEYAVFSAAPFLVVAGVAFVRQMRAPSAGKVDAALERVRAMSWEELAAALESGFRREGYAVQRGRGAVDLRLEKGGRVVLVAAKRWKASRTGMEPLRELHAAARAADHAECFCLCAGEVTDTARAYAKEKGVRLVEGVDLAKLAGAL